MTVYVDDMRAKFRHMVMCHMIADSEDELRAMADRIGVPLRYWQDKGKSRSHFDICLSKRASAVSKGAVEITAKQLAAMCFRRMNDGELGAPEDAVEWMLAYKRELTNGS